MVRVFTNHSDLDMLLPLPIQFRGSWGGGLAFAALLTDSCIVYNIIARWVKKKAAQKENKQRKGL